MQGLSLIYPVVDWAGVTVLCRSMDESRASPWSRLNMFCDEQSGALELGLPTEFACSRVVWPQLSVYGQLLRAEMVKDGQVLSLQVVSVADNGVSLCDMRHSVEEAPAL